MGDPDEALLRRRVKAELRKRLRGVRQAMPESACDARSRAIVARLLELPAFSRPRAPAAALFWPMTARHEVDLRPLDAALRARGARVAYPAIDARSGIMTFRFVDDLAAASEGPMGFVEPPPTATEATPAEIDVVVVPALAVDPAGQRIGYGAGFYDRTLPAWCPPAVSVAVAFDFQLLAEIPAEPGDVPTAWVVTDARTLQIGVGDR